MAKKKKEARQVITLECTEARALGKSPSRYSTMKNKKNTPKRLELKKYNHLDQGNLCLQRMRHQDYRILGSSMIDIEGIVVVDTHKILEGGWFLVD